MTPTSSRILQYLGLFLILALLGGGYWYFRSEASTAKRASNTGLVGYWSFDEGTGTKAGDASGQGNTGTLTNGPTWVDGKRGKAVNFDGTDDYVSTDLSMASRSVFTLSAWVKRSASNALVYIASREATPPGPHVQMGFFSDGVMYVSPNGSGGYLTTSSNSTDWIHAVYVFDGSQGTAALRNRIWINGVERAVSGTNTATSTASDAGTLDIGRRLAYSTYTNGMIDDVRVYNRVLGSTEITALYNLSAAKLNTSQAQSGSISSGLVGYWSFNGPDVSGTTAYDRSVTGNNGTLTNGPTVTPGISGQALRFDGSDDYISVKNSALVSANSAFSLGLWVKTSFNGDGQNLYTENNVANGELAHQVTLVTDGKIVYDTYTPSGGSLSSSSSINDGNWHYITVTRETNNTTSIYIDGILNISGSVADYDGGLTIDQVSIGRRHNSINTTQDDYFNGMMDEVRIYNRALAAGEIESLYRLGQPDKVNTSATSPGGSGRLDSGLALYWPLDDGSGLTATDKSTNGNNGTIDCDDGDPCVAPPTWTSGQIGSALDFDGTFDFINKTDADVLDFADSTNFSLSIWFNRDTFTTDDTIIAKSNGQTAADTGYNVYIDDTTDKVTFVGNDGTDQYKMESVSTFTATGWNHLVLSWNDSSSSETKLFINGVAESATTTGTFANVNSLTNALALRIGSESDTGNKFDGKIDDVRLYNRALSADEVSLLYKTTAPSNPDTGLKGYWSFNGPDLSGTTAYDRSGAGNNGTLTNGPTVTPGKLGQGINLDGTDDRVVVSSTFGMSTTNVTITGWVFLPTTSHSGAFVKIGDNQVATNNGFAIGVGGSNFDDNGNDLIMLFEGVRWIDTNTTIGTGWHQFAMVIDGSGVPSGYIDGTSVGSFSGTSASAPTNNTSYIGGYTGSGAQNRHADVKLDEIRIYNRPLSTPEIAALYNQGR